MKDKRQTNNRVNESLSEYAPNYFLRNFFAPQNIWQLAGLKARQRMRIEHLEAGQRMRMSALATGGG
jgi:hypothetical protein